MEVVRVHERRWPQDCLRAASAGGGFCKTIALTKIEPPPGPIPSRDLIQSVLAPVKALPADGADLHPNGLLCWPGYEFMLCVASIKVLLCSCLEPRAPPPLPRRTRLRAAAPSVAGTVVELRKQSRSSKCGSRPRHVLISDESRESLLRCKGRG